MPQIFYEQQQQERESVNRRGVSVGVRSYTPQLISGKQAGSPSTVAGTPRESSLVCL